MPESESGRSERRSVDLPSARLGRGPSRLCSLGKLGAKTLAHDFDHQTRWIRAPGDQLTDTTQLAAASGSLGFRRSIESISLKLSLFPTPESNEGTGQLPRHGELPLSMCFARTRPTTGGRVERPNGPGRTAGSAVARPAVAWAPRSSEPYLDEIPRRSSRDCRFVARTLPSSAPTVTNTSCSGDRSTRQQTSVTTTRSLSPPVLGV